MQAELFTDEDLLAPAAPLPQSGKVERSSLESAYRCIDYRAFADSSGGFLPSLPHPLSRRGANLLQLTLETYRV